MNCNKKYYKMNNGRFAISVHILTLLCKSEGDLLSSDYIAGSININPVLVRKEIANLKKAGFIQSKEGKNGGCYLAQAASDIRFSELFKRVYEENVLSHAKNEPNPNCPVGRDINVYLSSLYAEAEQALVDKLGEMDLQTFSKQFS